MIWPFSLFRSQTSNPLAGKRLRYLIGADDGLYDGLENNDITVVPYDHGPLKRGISVGYCNLFDEYNTGRYGPYLYTSDTARQYGEGQIDPKGVGWVRNLSTQFLNRHQQGITYIELDNTDAYKIEDVLGAIQLAEDMGLKVLAKNPALSDDPVRYLAHKNIYGAIVEYDAGLPEEYQLLRNQAKKPLLPIWFVFYLHYDSHVRMVAEEARKYKGMGVTISVKGEYETSTDLLVPL